MNSSYPIKKESKIFKKNNSISEDTWISVHEQTKILQLFFSIGLRVSSMWVSVNSQLTVDEENHRFFITGCVKLEQMTDTK